jgi:hypothetical protein
MMLRRRIGCTAALALLLAGSHRLQGQAPARDAFAAMRTDSVAWQRVLVHVIRSLSTELVRAAADTAAQPWEIRLPPAEPQRQLLGGQLRTILRARPIASTDSVTHRLEIGALRVVNDTALVEVQMQETRHCAGTTRATGSGYADTVRVPRHPQQKLWGAAFSRAVLVGERVGC